MFYGNTMKLTKKRKCPLSGHTLMPEPIPATDGSAGHPVSKWTRSGYKRKVSRLRTNHSNLTDYQTIADRSVHCPAR